MIDEGETIVSIDYAREQKRELERSIDKLVRDFTQETGLVIIRVSTPSSEVHKWPGGKVHFYGETEVEVKLP